MGLVGRLGGGLRGRLGGRLRGGLQQRGVQTGLGRGLAVKLMSGKVQVKSGLVQFWIR